MSNLDSDDKMGFQLNDKLESTMILIKIGQFGFKIAHFQFNQNIFDDYGQLIPKNTLFISELFKSYKK